MPRLIITEPNKTPQPYRFDLATESVKMGRAEDNDILVSCGSVSSHHAEMVRVPGGFELRDLGSTNGISKDDQAVKSVLLSNGDSLLLGDVAFDFTLNEEELGALAAEAADGDPETEAAHPGLPVAKIPEDAEPVRGHGAYTPSRPMARQSSAAMMWAFILLSAGALYFGMSMRHQNATGNSFGGAIAKKLNAPPQAPPRATRPVVVIEAEEADAEDERTPEEIAEAQLASAQLAAEQAAEIEGWEDRESREDRESENEESEILNRGIAGDDPEDAATTTDADEAEPPMDDEEEEDDEEPRDRDFDEEDDEEPRDRGEDGDDLLDGRE